MHVAPTAQVQDAWRAWLHLGWHSRRCDMYAWGRRPSVLCIQAVWGLYWAPACEECIRASVAGHWVVWSRVQNVWTCACEGRMSVCLCFNLAPRLRECKRSECRTLYACWVKAHAMHLCVRTCLDELVLWCVCGYACVCVCVCVYVCICVCGVCMYVCLWCVCVCVCLVGCVFVYGVCVCVCVCVCPHTHTHLFDLSAHSHAKKGSFGTSCMKRSCSIQSMKDAFSTWLLRKQLQFQFLCVSRTHTHLFYFCAAELIRAFSVSVCSFTRRNQIFGTCVKRSCTTKSTDLRQACILNK